MKSKEELKITKEWLWRYRRIYWKVEREEEEYQRIREELSGVRALLYDDMPSGSGTLGDLSDSMVRLEKQMNVLDAAVAELYEIASDVVGAIYILPEDVQQVMFKRYMEFEGWQQIAAECGLSLRSVHNKHREGLELVGIKRGA